MDCDNLIYDGESPICALTGKPCTDECEVRIEAEIDAMERHLLRGE